MSRQLHHLELERVECSCNDLEISRVDFVDGSSNEKSGFNNDVSICWTTVGTTIMFFNVSDGSLLCQWTFKQIKNATVNEITAVAEYNSCQTNKSFQLISLQTFAGNFLSVFALGEMPKVVTTIELPAKCVSIECFNNNVNFQPTEFSNFGGFAVLGFDPVQVLVLDLNESAFQTELSFHPQSLLKLKYIDYRLSTEKTCHKDESLCVKLTPCYCDGKVFNYCDTDGTVVKTVRKSVSVSCLKYFSALDVLAIGFDIARFQLWSLTCPDMMFASEFTEDVPRQISFFEFQAPEDDPRRCLYLWVAYSFNATANVASKPNEHNQEPHDDHRHHHHGFGAHGMDEFATLIMYQLNFDDSEHILLRTCRPALRIRLTPDVLLNSFDGYNTSKLLSMGICSALNSKPDVSSQIYFCWQFENNRTLDDDEAHGSEVQVGLFDLNCWYEAQMPQFVRLLPDQSFCPYFCVYNCSQNLFLSQDTVSTFSLLPSSLVPFEFSDVPPPDFCSWLCSYSLEGVFLSDKGIIVCKGDAIQKRVLDQCEDLVDVEQFNQNNITGLNRALVISKLYDPTEFSSLLYDPSTQNSVSQNSTFVSSGELQSVLKSLLVYGDHDALLQIFTIMKNLEVLGPESNLPTSFFDAVQGLWLHLSNLIKTFDAFSLSLFNYEAPEMNKNFDNKFFKMLQQLKLYASFFRLFCDTFVTDQHSSPVTLEEYLAVVNVLDYYNVVEWMSELCFLPEVNPDVAPENGEGFENGFRFPVFELDQLYEQCKGLFSMEGHDNCLLFNYLLDCFAIELDYPCKGFHEILTKIFRNPKCAQPFDVKLAVFNYIFMDIAAVLCPGDKFEEITVLSLLQNKNWLNCIKSLWYIDHGFTEMASTYICASDLTVLPSNIVSSIIARLVCLDSLDSAYHVLQTCSCRPVDDFERKMAISVCLCAKKILMASEMLAGSEDESVVEYFFEEIERFALTADLLRVNWKSLDGAIIEFIANNDASRFGYLRVLKQALGNSQEVVFDKQKTVHNNQTSNGPDPVANISKLLRDLADPESEQERPVFVNFPESEECSEDLDFTLNKPLVTNVLRNTAKYRSILNQNVTQPKVPKFDKWVSHTSNQSMFDKNKLSKVLSHKVTVSSSSGIGVKEGFSLNSPAALHLLSTPEVQRKSRVTDKSFSDSRRFRSILKESMDFDTSSAGSPMLDRIALHMKPEFAFVDSPGMSPFKPKFAKTPMPRGRISGFANSKNGNALQDDAVAKPETPVSGFKKGAIVVDDEISFSRKHEESVSSTEAHNATVVIMEEEKRLTSEKNDNSLECEPMPSRRIVNCFIDDQDNSSPVSFVAPEEEPNFEFEAPAPRIDGSLKFQSLPTELEGQQSEKIDGDDNYRFSYPYLKTQSCVSNISSQSTSYAEAMNQSGHGDRKQVTENSYFQRVTEKHLSSGTTSSRSTSDESVLRNPQGSSLMTEDSTTTTTTEGMSLNENETINESDMSVERSVVDSQQHKPVVSGPATRSGSGPKGVKKTRKKPAKSSKLLMSSN